MTVTIAVSPRVLTLTEDSDGAVVAMVTGAFSDKVPKSLFDANTVLAATSDNTPAAVTVAEQTLIGRITGGNITALTSTQAKTLLNVPLSCLWLSGTAGNYVSAPDTAGLSITGDIEFQCRVALDDWTPAAAVALISKRVNVGQYSYYFGVSATTGYLAARWSADGTNLVGLKESTVAPSISDGVALWVRATIDVDNGATGNDVKFYTAADSETVPTSWTQLGTTVTTAATTSIFDGTDDVRLGHRTNSADTLTGKLYRARILNGIAGSVAADFRADVPAVRYRDTASNVWTVNGTANAWMVA